MNRTAFLKGVISHRRRPFFLALLFLIVIVAWLFIPGEETELVRSEPVLMPVSVTERAPTQDKVSVSTTGLTQPRWETAVKAAVGGRVVRLAEPLEPGTMIRKSQKLVSIDAVNYQADVAQAKSRVADAELNLARTRHEQTVVLNSDKNTQSLTPLARHEPQVKAAEAEKQSSDANLAVALKNLSDTQVTAPFDGIVLERKVTPSKWVQPGEELLLIADSGSIDIKVELPATLWNRLGDVTPGHDGYRDQQTRQRSLMLKVENPYEGEHRLYPDQQVQVRFEGKAFDQVFNVPASSITDDGQVWTLDEKNQLVLETVVTLFSPDADNTLLRFVNEPETTRRIVLYPLGSMIAGQIVEPVLDDSTSRSETGDQG